MKIGILTLPLGRNYGGILQAWALQKTLQRIGHDVMIIDLREKDYIASQLKIFFLRCYSKFVKKKPGVEIFRSENNVSIKNTLKFIKHNFKYLRIYAGDKSKLKKLNALVVGSDQVWRPIYADSHLNDYFLEFANDLKIPKIAYAASFGVDTIEFSHEEIKMASRQITQFDTVSVREDTGVELCRKMLNFENAIQMPDPTLLLTADDYRSVIKERPNRPSIGTLFTYILDKSKQAEEIVSQFINRYGYVQFTVHSRIDDPAAPLNERIHPPLEEWLTAFEQCKFVITDSFHGCVFSIIFNKDFIVTANGYRGLSRIDSLLRQFNLSHRLITFFEKVPDIDKIPPIDWKKVNIIKKQLERQGYLFLKNELS